MSEKQETWVLLLNDMRTDHFENLQPVCQASSHEELEALVERETVSTYKDDKGNGDGSWWGKTFRKGGPLEWCNQPSWDDKSYQQVYTKPLDVPTIQALNS